MQWSEIARAREQGREEIERKEEVERVKSVQRERERICMSEEIFILFIFSLHLESSIGRTLTVTLLKKFKKMFL